jgi:hypothetical protein
LANLGERIGAVNGLILHWNDIDLELFLTSSSLRFIFCYQRNHPPNRFGTRWEVDLAAAPVVDRPQKVLGYAHLKRTVLGALRWPAASLISHLCMPCIDN